MLVFYILINLQSINCISGLMQTFHTTINNFMKKPQNVSKIQPKTTIQTPRIYTSVNTRIVSLNHHITLTSATDHPFRIHNNLIFFRLHLYTPDHRKQYHYHHCIQVPIVGAIAVNTPTNTARLPHSIIGCNH